MRPRHRAGVLLACLVCATPAPSNAHQGHHDSSLRLLLKPEGLHVSVRYKLPVGERAQQARLAWDVNGDGRLDRGETESALDRLEKRLASRLLAEIDGLGQKARAVRRDGRGFVGSARSDEALSASFQLVYDFGAHPGKHRLVLRAPDTRGDRHLPATFQPGRGIALGAHNGREQRRGDQVLIHFALHADRPLRLGYSILPTQ